MDSFDETIICRRCGAPKMHSWDQLSDEEKYLVERLPFFDDSPLNERKKHRYCTRCWFEDKGSGSAIA